MDREVSFVGAWILNVEKSEFDAHRRPVRAPWSSNVTPKDVYLQKAEGINEKGKECMERPVRFIPDGSHIRFRSHWIEIRRD